MDRVTGQPYQYLVVDATHFQVGATFALPGEPDISRFESREDADFWKHGEGWRTFTIDVTREVKN